ncbi:hypothetical protein OPU71_14255 [Niveibacterium sp. 24ML]|uniref:hypothetical protein n=1 Tax=Niveibacterium sp. 24ML TaxID=2985512 RepID=UPI00226DB332|nr:hypothetical protein [Niveibacterium sp. 24ML]MCX9157287.1 hypothetical protein [Niveibacterium sp. 24ML]
MAIHLNNVRISNCGGGISAPKDAEIHANNLEIVNTAQAIELRDPPSILQRLGLPPETPPEYLIEALKILEATNDMPQNERLDRLRESKLIKWLGVTADLTGLGTTLISAQAAGLVSSLFEKVVGA